MTRSLRLGAVALLLSLPLTASAQERHTLSGDDVAIYNLIGSIRITAGSGGAVGVQLTRGGADAARLTIETGALRGRETLRVVYPGDRFTYAGQGGSGNTTMRVRENGTFGDGGDRRGVWRAGREVRIGSREGGLEAWADLEISVPRGQKLAVYLGVGRATVTNVEGDLRVDAASADITAEGTRGRLDLDTGSGAIDVTNADGDLVLDTGSGDIRVAGTRGSDLNIDTGSGTVTIDRVEADQLSVDTGSGDVRISAARARRVEIDTGSGEVDLVLLADVESINIDTGSGDVTLTVPEGVGATLDLDTSSGDIEFDFPIQVRRVERDHVQGTVGDGRGSITIDVGSGSIRLKRG